MRIRFALAMVAALALAACGPAPTPPAPPRPPETAGKQRIPDIDGLNWAQVKDYYDQCMQFKDIADPRFPYVAQDCRAIRARWDRRDLARQSTATKAPQLPTLH